MIERQILRVIYSPFKAFEDIVKTPSAKGPLLILALGVALAAIAGFVSFSKVDVQLESETGPYVPLITTSTFGARIFLVAVDEAISLSLAWLILVGMILLVIKLFRMQEGSWKALFFVVGYTLITSVVGTLITALCIFPLPTVQLGWGIWNPTTQEMVDAAHQGILKAYEIWFSSPTYRFLSYLPYIVQVWATALAAISIRALLGVSWNKAVTISAMASVLTFLIRLAVLYM